MEKVRQQRNPLHYRHTLASSKMHNSYGVTYSDISMSKNDILFLLLGFFSGVLSFDELREEGSYCVAMEAERNAFLSLHLKLSLINFQTTLSNKKNSPSCQNRSLNNLNASMARKGAPVGKGPL